MPVTPLRRPPLLFALLLTAFAATTPAHAQTGGQQPIPAVVVAPAEMTSLNESASFTGRLVAVQQVEIRARVTGYLQDITFEEGNAVAEGDVLFRIEDDVYAAALEQIEGQIVAARAERELAELERDRQAELVSRQASPQRNLDQAEAAIGQSEGALMTLEAQKRQANLDLSYTQVRAPFAGTVGLTTYDIGALVGPESGALVLLTRTDPIYADFAVSSRVVQDFQEAMERGEVPETASVTIRRANGSIYDRIGTVTFVDDKVSEGTDTVLVRATFDNPEGHLKDGEFVGVILQDTEETAHLTVPAQSVSRNLAGNFVMLVGNDGTVEQRIITTGPTVQGRTEVTGGLEEGDMVITEGLNKVRPGIKVDAATAPTPADNG